MACYSPIPAHRGEDGGLVFSTKAAASPAVIQLKCGRCIGCKLERALSWSIRTTHEAQTAKKASFLTLTFDEEHLPEDWSVQTSDWQHFAKAVRNHFGSFRYFHVGEYGDENLRPHYHAIVFGKDWSDSRYRVGTKNGRAQFQDDTLSELWGKGNLTLENMSWGAAAYVSRYATKKINGDDSRAWERYGRVDQYGNEWRVKADYATMSLKPGIGTRWFHRYWKDVYPHDFVIMNGKKYRPPKFYDRLLEVFHPQVWEKVRTAREEKFGTRQWKEWNKPYHKEAAKAVAERRLKRQKG